LRMQGQVLREFARMEAVKAACQDPASLEHAIAMRAFQRIETIVQVGVMAFLQGNVLSRDACLGGCLVLMSTASEQGCGRLYALMSQLRMAPGMAPSDLLAACYSCAQHLSRIADSARSSALRRSCRWV
jgi:hypothetical protein